MGFSVEEGYRYASRLRGKLEHINPPNWVVDWSDAPWPLKIYTGGRRIQLGGIEPPWMTGESKHSGRASLERLLFYAVGCTRLRWVPPRSVQDSPELMLPGLNVGRAIASGGAMYPAEIYVYARALHDLPGGLYHYNPARHELVEIRHALSEEDMCRALRLSTPSALREAVVVVTNYFWKNFYKYADFSYRLGAVNVGVAVGRLHRLGEMEFGEASAQFSFDDNLLNELLGVQGLEESAYAALLLGPAGASAEVHAPDDHDVDTRATEPGSLLVRERRRSRVIKRSSEFDAMHQSILDAASASGAASDQLFTLTHGEGRESHEQGIPLPVVEASPLQDLRGAIFRRVSNGAHFTGGTLPNTLLAASLWETHAALQRLHRSSPDRALPYPQLYCIIQRVQGIEAGAYKYEYSTHSLIPIRMGHFGRELQTALYGKNVNIEMCAYTLHIVDTLDFRKSSWGNRAYRIQQMLAGAALDTVMLVSSDRQASSHVLLGFNAALIDRLYALDTSPCGVLAQICVGTARHGLYREGSLIS